MTARKLLHDSAVLAALLLAFAACSDDAAGGAGDVGSDRTRPDRGGAEDGEDIGDDRADEVGSDLTPSATDSDGDGLSNVCEQGAIGLDPNNPDSDGDGIRDGDEDRNRNCTLDPGETDPAREDTDGDGITDPAEARFGTDPADSDSDDDGINDGNEVAFSQTDPTVADSDGDGCLDGVEDRDGDGRIGRCEPGAYSVVCADGETDPNEEDTDGDGVGDCDEVGFAACSPEGLREPQLARRVEGDLTLAFETDVATGGIGFSGVSGSLPTGVWIDDEPHGIAGFALTLTPPDGATEPGLLADRLLAAAVSVDAGAARRTTGRPARTHDNFSAVVGLQIELPGASTADAFRLELVAALAGVARSEVELAGSATFETDESGLLGAFSVVARGSSSYVVVGAITTRVRYADDTAQTGIRVDDLTGGTALATFDAELEAACVAYEVTGRPEIDFIWSIDGSGSMGNERERVADFAEDFGTILSALDIDFRLGVIGGECSFIGGDDDVSAEARALVAGGDFDCTGSFPIIGGFLPGANGTLCNNAFTRDATVFASCVERMSEIGGEYTVSMGAVAIDRALPRQPGSGRHIRPGAEVVLVVVTDEHEQSFEDILDWVSGATTGPSDAAEQAEIDSLVARYTAFFGRPDVEGTVFGIYWVPNEACSGAAEVAFGIHDVVRGTGGTAGSICLTDITTTLEEIAAASSGLASTFRLSGRPVALTLKVATAAPGSVAAEVPRHRSDGFDFDSAVNRVVFVGSAAPEPGDEVTISYQRWVGGTLGCVTDDDCPIKFYCRGSECI